MQKFHLPYSCPQVLDKFLSTLVGWREEGALLIDLMEQFHPLLIHWLNGFCQWLAESNSHLNNISLPLYQPGFYLTWLELSKSQLRPKPPAFLPSGFELGSLMHKPTSFPPSQPELASCFYLNWHDPWQKGLFPKVYSSMLQIMTVEGEWELIMKTNDGTGWRTNRLNDSSHVQTKPKSVESYVGKYLPYYVYSCGLYYKLIHHAMWSQIRNN